MKKTDHLTSFRRELMNTTETPNTLAVFRPHRTQTIFSCKRNAWLLLDAFKKITPNPTFKILLDLANTFPSNIDRAPIDDLFYIYPYLSISFRYKNVVLDFMDKKNIDEGTKLNRAKILQFLAFCDGYSSWENMAYHLGQSDQKLITFSFQREEPNDQLSVFTFYDDETHANHGAKLAIPLLCFPEYEVRKLLGCATPHHHQRLLIAHLLRAIPLNIPDKPTEERYIEIIYGYFRDIQHIHTELLITELDIRQLIEFEMQKRSENVAISPSSMAPQRESAFKALLELISLEEDIFKKSQLAISFIQNSKFQFHEILNILQLFQNIDTDKPLAYKKLSLDADLHDLIQPWFQYVCEQLRLMKDEIQSYLFHDFSEDSGQKDIEDLYPYFIAKELTISNIMYEIVNDMLSIEADYLLKLDVDNSRITFENELSKGERFKARETFGSFGVTVDRNKKIDMVHCDIAG